MKSNPAKFKHTPIPWRIAESVAEKDCWYLESQYPNHKGELEWIPIGEDDGTMDYEDAAFIVRAVNNFDQMLSVLKLCRDEWPERFTPCYKELSEIIAKAESL